MISFRSLAGKPGQCQGMVKFLQKSSAIKWATLSIFIWSKSMNLSLTLFNIYTIIPQQSLNRMVTYIMSILLNKKYVLIKSILKSLL